MAPAVFAPLSQYQLGASPAQAVAAVLIPGGAMDAIAVIPTEDAVSVSLGNGHGGLGTPAVYYVGPDPVSVAVGDFNGDGIPDIATANAGNDTVSVLLGNGSGAFGPKYVGGVSQRDYPVGGNPQYIVAGDFDTDAHPNIRTDGFLDLATADYAGAGSSAPTLSVLTNNGDGTFGAAWNASIGPQWWEYASSLAVADFNGDGIPDLAIGNPYTNDVQIADGNGNGTFTYADTVHVTPVDGSPDTDFVAAADLNGDGDADLVVAQGTGQTTELNVLLGNGNNTFGTQTNYPTDAKGPSAVAIGRLVSGGPEDLVVTNAAYAGSFGQETAGGVSVLLGNGNGTFKPAVDYDTGAGPGSVVLADFNADGNLDILTADQTGNDLTVDLGNGNGTFAAGVNYAVYDPAPADPNGGGDPQGLAVTADFNGVPSIVVVSNGPQSIVSVLPGNGDGTFQAPVNTYVGYDPRALVVGNFNGPSGGTDVATVNADGGTVTILSGFSAAAGFSSVTNLTDAGICTDIVAADLTGNGYPDLILSRFDVPEVEVLMNNGDGTFAPPVTFPTLGSQGSLALITTAADTFPSLAIATVYPSTLSTMQNLGDTAGTWNGFAAPVQIPNYTGADYAQLTTADLNGDGNTDIITTGNDGSHPVTVYLGNGDGTFQNGTTIGYLPNTTTDAVVAADLNNDGYPDLITADGTADNVSVFLNNGNNASGVWQGFASPTTVNAGTDVSDVAVADLNGDGLPDIVAANLMSENVTVLIQAGTPAVSITGANDLGPGASETLTAAGTDPQGSSLTYQWDLNYVGTTFMPTVTGTTATFQAGLAAATTTVAVRAINLDGVSSQIATATITNAALFPETLDPGQDVPTSGLPSTVDGQPVAAWTISVAGGANQQASAGAQFVTPFLRHIGNVGVSFTALSEIGLVLGTMSDTIGVVSPPNNLYATEPCPGRVNLTWTYQAPTFELISGYLVTVTPAGGTEPGATYNVNSYTQTFLDVQNLAPKTVYTIAVYIKEMFEFFSAPPLSAPATLIVVNTSPVTPGDVTVSSDGDGNTVVTESGTALVNVATASIDSIAVTGDIGGSLAVDYSDADPLPVDGLSTDATAVAVTGGNDDDTLTANSMSAVYNDGSSILDSQMFFNPGTHLTFEGAETGDEIVIQAGNVTVAGDGSNPGPSVVVEAGSTVIFSGSQTLSGLTIEPGGLAQVQENGTFVLTTNAFDLEHATAALPGGLLDLTDNDLVIQGDDVNNLDGYTPGLFSLVPYWLASGYDHGRWDALGGTGPAPAAIISTVVAADSSLPAGLGYAVVAPDGPVEPGLFDDVPVVSGDMVVRYTFAGDVNLDGNDDDADRQIIENDQGDTGLHWPGGDVTYAGVVNGSDLSAWNQTSGNVLTFSSVPANGAYTFTLPVSALEALAGLSSITEWTINFGDGTPSLDFSYNAASGNPVVSHTYSTVSSGMFDLSLTLQGNTYDGSGVTCYLPHQDLVVTPAAPTGLAATESTPGQIDLHWSETAVASGYVVTATSAANGSATTQYVSAGLLNCSAMNLTAGAAYKFTVSAMNTLADGITSTSAAETIDATADAVNELTASNVSASLSNTLSNAITVTWNDSNASWDDVLVSINGSNYSVYSDVTTSFGSGSCTLSNLLGDTTYWFEIVPSEGSQSSLPTTPVTQTLPFVAPTLSAVETSTPVAGGPVSLSLSAQYPSNDPQADEIQYWLVNWGFGRGYQKYQGPVPVVTDSGPATSTENVSVEAVDGKGHQIAPINETISFLPAQPAGLTATYNADGTAVILTWQSSTFAQTYTVSRLKSAQSAWQTLGTISDESNLTYVDTDVPPGTAGANAGYLYSVTAVSSTGLHSAPASAAPSANGTTGASSSGDSSPTTTEITLGGTDSVPVYGPANSTVTLYSYDPYVIDPTSCSSVNLNSNGSGAITVRGIGTGATPILFEDSDGGHGWGLITVVPPVIIPVGVATAGQTTPGSSAPPAGFQIDIPVTSTTAFNLTFSTAGSTAASSSYQFGTGATVSGSTVTVPVSASQTTIFIVVTALVTSADSGTSSQLTLQSTEPLSLSPQSQHDDPSASLCIEVPAPQQNPMQAGNEGDAHRLTIFLANTGKTLTPLQTSSGINSSQISTNCVYIDVPTDDVDANNNGVPDWADGLVMANVPGQSVYAGASTTLASSVDGQYFVPVTISINSSSVPAPNINPSCSPYGTISFNYAESDPNQITLNNSGTPGDPYQYNLPSNGGSLRLWIPGGFGRIDPSGLSSQYPADIPDTLDPRTTDAGGDFIPANTALNAFDIFGYGTTATIYIQGICPSTAAYDNAITATGVTMDGSSAGLEVTSVGFTLADDSRNLSDGSPSEDQDGVAQHEQADSATSPGKIIVANDADTNGDGIPDDGEGFTGALDAGPSGFNNASQSASVGSFVPIVITLPAYMNPNADDVALQFAYDASDPAQGGYQPDVVGAWAYTPAPGTLRIWNVNESTSRSALPVSQGGNFVAPDSVIGITATPWDYYDQVSLNSQGSSRSNVLTTGGLNFSPVYNGGTLAGYQTTLYVEGIRPTGSGGTVLTITVDPDGIAPPGTATTAFGTNGMPPHYYWPYMASESIKFTVLQPYAPDAAVSGPVRLADDSFTYSQTDLSTDGGVPWALTRTWSDAPEVLAATGGQTGWLNFPQLLQATGDVIALLPSETLYFAKTSTGSYQELFDGDWQLAYSPATHLWTVCDSAGDRWLFNGFNSSSAFPNAERGEFAGYEDPAGNQITAQYFYGPGTPAYELGRISSISRNYLSSTNANSAVGVIATFTYSPQGQLATATATNTGSATDGTTTITRVATYQYDTVAATSATPMPFDNFGDLISVTVNQGTGLVSQEEYRYLPKNAVGLSVLSAVFDTDDILRMKAASGGPLNPFTSPATTAAMGYATLVYNLSAYALQGTGASSATSPSALGVTSITPSLLNGVGSAQGGQFFAFTNLVWNIPQADNINPSFGTIGDIQPLNMSGIYNPPEGVNSWSVKSVNVLPGGAAVTDYLNIFGQLIASSTLANNAKYYAYNRYDTAGRTIISTDSAAVNSIDETTLNAAVLNQSAGDFSITDYNADGDVTLTGVSNGTNGSTGLSNTSSDSLLPQLNTESFTYLPCTSTDSGPALTITLVATDKVYPGSGEDVRVTSYNYSSFTDLQPTTTVTTLPTYASGFAAATGTAVTMATSTTTIVSDTFGRPVSTTDADGYVTTTAYDNTAADTGLVIQTNADTATLNLVDKVTSWDGLGRPLTETDPDGHVTQYIYRDGANVGSSLSYIQGDDLADATFYNASAGTISNLTIFIGNSGSAASSSTQAYPVISLSQTITDYGGRTLETLQYPSTANDTFAVSSGLTIAAGNGSPYTSTDAYDAEGLLYLTVDTHGERTETDHDQLGRVTQIGECNTAVSANTGAVVQVDSYAPASGQTNPDGLLMSVTQNTGTSAAPNRTTKYFYDWQGTLVGTQSDISGTFLTLDQAGDVLKTQTFATGTGTGQATISAGAEPTLSGSILAETDDTYDDQGQLYLSAVDWVDPNTFAVNTSLQLATYSFHDGRGDVVETVTPAGLVTDDTYDGAGRVTEQVAGDRAADVFSDVETVYDSDGNPILVTTYDYNDAGNSVARTTAVASWYDVEGRPVATANYGTNPAPVPGVSSWPAVPTQSSLTSALVTTYSYNDSGQSVVQTDPLGIATFTQLDALGRVQTSVADYVASTYGTSNAASSSLPEDVNVPTNYVYNSMGQLTAVRATINAGQANGTATYVATTTYAYTDPINPSLATAVSDPSGLSANGSASTPTPASTYYAYDWLGDIITEVDRYGDTHNYTYDAAGDQTSDWVSGFGPGIDQSVTKLSTGYDALGRPIAYNSSTGANGSGGVVNSIARSYNGFGQVTSETQTPFTQFPASAGTIVYGYNNSSSSSLLQNETYPDGREIQYDYNGTDAQLGRVSDVANVSYGPGPGIMESYSYLGLGTVVGRTLPMAGNMTESTALTTFGQVQSVSWNRGSSMLDGYSYTYDLDGNPLTRANLLQGSQNQSFAYDKLGHLSAWALVANNFPDLYFTLDSQGDRLSTTVTQPSGSTTTSSNVSVIGSELSGESANAGGATQAVQIDGPNTKATLTFDAWGRVVKVKYWAYSTYSSPSASSFDDAAISLTQSYFYDALGRVVGTNTIDSYGSYYVPGYVTYYDIGNNPVEEKPTAGPANQPSAEYVWSAAGPSRLVEKNYIYGMFFPTTDADGSVTAVFQVTNGSGQTVNAVAERYIYNCDGMVQAYSGSWQPFTATSYSSPTQSQIGWNVLWHGMRYDSLYFAGEIADYAVNASGDSGQSSYAPETEPTGGGLYLGMAGGGWYDPQHGRAIVPNPAAPGTSPYDPHAGTLFESTWLANHAGQVAVWSTVAAAVAISAVSAGTLAPEAAEAVGGVEAATAVGTTAAAEASGGSLLVSGATLGTVTTAESSYAAGNSYQRIALDATVGAVAGAAGAAVGGAVAAQFCPAAIEGWVASGVAGGAVGGGIQGGLEGYIDHGVDGIAAGALQGAVSGAAFGGIGAVAGYGVFRGLGLLDGLSCFIAGTEVAYEIGTPGENGGREEDPIAVAEATYLSIAIEKITQGFEILARDENDPFGPLRKCVVDKVFCRIAFHLRVLTLRMSDGREQTIYTTDEHSAHNSVLGWTPASELRVGDLISEGSGGVATVIRTFYERHPEGIEVYNFRVAEAHTYLIRAAGFDGEVAWVHNMYRGSDGQFARDPADPPVDIYTRDNQYGGFRDSTVEALREKYADPETGEILDPTTGDPIPEDQLTWDHYKETVVDHWNRAGRNMSRAQRNDWYNQIDNLQPMSRTDAASQGGTMSAAGKRYSQTVGPNYSS